MIDLFSNSDTLEIYLVPKFSVLTLDHPKQFQDYHEAWPQYMLKRSNIEEGPLLQGICISVSTLTNLRYRIVPQQPPDQIKMIFVPT